MKRRKAIKRGSKPNPVNRKRKARNHARSYGTKAHQDWLRSKPCVGCGIEGTEDHPIVLHHTRTGGASRKADAETQVPLCVRDHGIVHQPGLRSYAHLSRDVLQGHAERLWAEWLALSGESSGGSA